MRHVLKLCAALSLLATPAQAQLSRPTPIQSEVAAVIARLAERAPFRTWDDLRLSAPRSVRWHLSPPDEEEARLIRRSGWMEADGVQAGIAACGDRRGPEIVTLRVDGATWRSAQQDSVIVALSGLVQVNLQYHEPTMVGEVEHFELTAENGRRASVQREENCSREGGAAMRRCDTTYTLDVRPNYASAPTAHDCRAP